jgi:hypothetical protein
VKTAAVEVLQSLSAVAADLARVIGEAKAALPGLLVAGAAVTADAAQRQLADLLALLAATRQGADAAEDGAPNPA